ncbi:MAG: hypothetical protein H7Y00_08540 [Fimbriimonadaceae bacterium]|nr:hypothetical protein [Chitinophagales bacterium]
MIKKEFLLVDWQRRLRLVLGLFILILFSFAFNACKKEPIENDANLIISDTPYIELRSVSANTVTEYEDSIIFEIFYQDGDGDLGYANPDSLSLTITDSRIFTVQQYYIPLLSPEGSGVTIEGVLNLKLDNTIMIDDTNASETVQFKIQIKDRNGNYSNYVTSENITVLPD